MAGETNPGRNAGPDDGGPNDDYESLSSSFYDGDLSSLDIPDPLTFLTHSQRMMEGFPRLDTSASLKTIESLSSMANFSRRGKPLVIGRDAIGLVHFWPGQEDGKINGKFKSYADYIAKARLKKPESASHGWGKFGNHVAGMYLLEPDYMGGSAGVVAGEEWQRLNDALANRRRKHAMVGEIGTGGARQQEQSPALVQMERISDGISNFKFRNESKQPLIVILAGPVFGGISASLVPEADLIIGIKGADYGFSGPRVIATYEGKELPAGAQRVEKALIERRIDLVVGDAAEAYEVVAQYLEAINHGPKVSRNQPARSNSPRSNQAQQEKQSAFIDEYPENVDQIEQQRQRQELNGARTIKIGKMGIAGVLNDDPESEEFVAEPPEVQADSYLMGVYEELRRSAARPDSEFIMRQILTDMVPLYNHRIDPLYKTEGSDTTRHVKLYPGIIASIGKIEGQPFLVIGHQPTYQVNNGRISKIPSTPGPEDYKYVQRMLKTGERLGLPAILLCDTLGALPTLDAEERGISDELSHTISACNQYKPPLLSVVIGPLGSGGGLALAPIGDYRAFTDKAMMFVSAPHSFASIVQGSSNPTNEQVKIIVDSMKATAKDQEKLKLSDETITEADNPYDTALNISNSIMRAYKKIFEDFRNDNKRMEKRIKRIRSQDGGFAVKEID